MPCVHSEVILAREYRGLLCTSSPVYPRTFYTDLNGLFCKAIVPVPCTAHHEMTATGSAPPLVRW